MKKTMIIAALAAVGLSASASAFTFEKSKLTLGVMPVYSMPQGNRGDVLDNSLGLNISGEYVVQDNIKLGLEMGYAFGYDAKGRYKLWDSDYDIKVFNFGPTVKYFGTNEKLSYYAVAGLGFYNWKSAEIVNRVPADSGSDFGLNVGFGAGYELSTNWTGGLEMRYHTVGGDLNTDFINLGFKLDYKF